MTTTSAVFDPSRHPRGGAGNPGRFTRAAPVPPDHPLATNAMAGALSESEARFFALAAAGRRDGADARDAIRAAGRRLFPHAAALRFHLNYGDDDGDTVLVLYGPVGQDGHVGETTLGDPVDDVLFTWSGAGHTGQDIPGMRPAGEPGDDLWEFPLR